jgi:hypothetical protein
MPEEGWEHHLESVPGLGLGAIRIRTFTRWVPASGGQLPRELAVEVSGHAGSLDEAVVKFQTIGWPIAAMIGFITNVRVGLLEVHLAYECTAGRAERPFLEVFFLELLRSGGRLFGWEIDQQAITNLLDEARELNEISVNSAGKTVSSEP